MKKILGGAAIAAVSMMTLSGCSTVVPEYKTMAEVTQALVKGGLPCFDPYEVYDDYNKQNQVTCYDAEGETYVVHVFDSAQDMTDYFASNSNCDAPNVDEAEKTNIHGLTWVIDPTTTTGSANLPFEQFQSALGGQVSSDLDLAGCK